MYVSYTGYFMLLLATAVLTECDSTIPEIKECSSIHPNITRFIWGRTTETCDSKLTEVSLDTVDWEECEKGWKHAEVTAIVEDIPVPDDTDNRAERTLPPGMILKESGIPGAGRGLPLQIKNSHIFFYILTPVDWEECENWEMPQVTAIIENPVVPDDTDNRAERTLPPGMILKESGIHGAGRGIWTEKLLEKGTILAPYEGETYVYLAEHADDDHVSGDSGFSWLITCNDRIILYTDAKDERRSNWLRWINTPMRHVDENIKSYQYRGQRYYITSKPIQPGTELLVSYGRMYTELYLGINMMEYYHDGIDWLDCDENSENDHPTHPLTIIQDTPVPDECDDRAKRSLPPGLVVKESGVPGAGLGVWAERFFPEGVRFGPFVGETFEYEKEDESGYSFIILCGEREIYDTDAEDERKSNWLRYVNTARLEDELNLNTYQQNGRIYYWTSKPIHPGTELLGFSGEDYGRSLGIDMDNYYNKS